MKKRFIAKLLVVTLMFVVGQVSFVRTWKVGLVWVHECPTQTIHMIIPCMA